MIDFINLNTYISNIIKSNSTIIYIGVGTHYYGNNNNEIDNNTNINLKEWEFKYNQQFPPFIHDAKLKYFDKKILIILIDPAFKNNKPYIVTDSNNFLDKSWTQSNIHSNLFESDMNLSVITISEYIKWGCFNNTNDIIYYDIKPFLCELCELISNPDIDSILFYHEFTGKNTILLENIIKESVCFDNNKICIDITRGADLSCYFNLTDPENYPIIIVDEDSKLKYLNFLNLDKIKIRDIISTFKEINLDFFSINKNESNILFDKPYELILYFQIIKYDSILINLIKNSIISTLRQFYTMTEKINYGSKMYFLQYFHVIKSQINLINFDIIIDKLKIIDNINLNNSDKDYESNFNKIHNSLLEEFYILLKLLLNNLLFKYNIDMDYIENFIFQLKNLNNKYNIIKYYDNFINILNIKT